MHEPLDPSAPRKHDLVSEGATEQQAFGRVLGVLAGLAALIVATYVVTPLHSLRPWVAGGDYVPFWNVVGREWLDEGERWEAEAEKLAQLKRQTQAPPEPVSAPLRRAPEPVPIARVFPPYFAASELERPEHGIEPPEALDYFFLKLTLADLG